MPFARDTFVAPSNIVLDGGPGIFMGSGIWGSEPEPPVAMISQPDGSTMLCYSDATVATYHQITLLLLLGSIATV